MMLQNSNLGFMTNSTNFQTYSENPANTTLLKTPIHKEESLMISFNCDDIDHYFKDSPSTEKIIFSYRCGNLGFYLPQCPNCKMWSLNYWPRTNAQGTIPPHQPNSVPKTMENKNFSQSNKI